MYQPANYPLIVFNSSYDAAERSTGDIINVNVGGSLILVDSRKTSAPLGPDSVRVRPEKLDEVCCTAGSTQRPCTVQVAADCSGAVLRFMEDFPGTLQDFKAVILSSTPDKDAQEKLVATLQALVSLGMEQTQTRIFLVQAPRNQPMEAAFPVLTAHLQNARVRDVLPPAVLHESAAFSRIREHQLSVAAILNDAIDFHTLREESRQRHDDERVLHELSRKLLAQRALHACRGDIETAFSALRLPGISPQKNGQQQTHLASREPEQAAYVSNDAMSPSTPSAVSEIELYE
jgi:hypothetical protein